MILFANPGSHFSLQKPIYIMGHFFTGQQIGTIDSSLLSLVTRHSLLITHCLVWIAKPLNTNVLQHFHQKIMTTSITYSIENHYYMHYFQRNQEPIGNPSKTLKTVDFTLKIGLTQNPENIGIMRFC